MKSMKAGTRYHTNTSQVETTIHNQSITSRREGVKLPRIEDMELLPNRRIRSFIDLDETQQLQIKSLKMKKKELYNLINEKRAEEGLEITRQLVNQCSTYDVQIFGRAINLLGDMYVSARDFANALYAYNVLRLLSDYAQDHRMKIQAFVQMADLCKLQQMYLQSKIFLKKALQYIWYLGDGEAECMIYDYLGVLFYVQGDLRMAQEFHDRAMNYILEAEDSASRTHGIENVRSHFRKQTIRSSTMNLMILSKMGMFQADESEIKLTTHFEFPQLLAVILEDVEFVIESSTPNKAQRVIVKNGQLQKDVEMFQSVERLHERQKKIRFFEKKVPDLRITRSILKLSIEEQLRSRKVDKKQQSIEQYRKWLSKFHTFRSQQDQPLSRVNINHLSPNRNLIGFKYNFKPMKKQLLKLVNDMEMCIFEQAHS